MVLLSCCRSLSRFSSLVRLSFRNSLGLDYDPLFSPPLRGGVGGGGSETLSIGGLSMEICVSLLLFAFLFLSFFLFCLFLCFGFFDCRLFSYLIDFILATFAGVTERPRSAAGRELYDSGILKNSRAPSRSAGVTGSALFSSTSASGYQEAIEGIQKVVLFVSLRIKTGLGRIESPCEASRVGLSIRDSG